MLNFTHNLRGVKTYVELGSASELGAQLWSALNARSSSKLGVEGGGVPHFHTFETVRRHCTTMACWEGCGGDRVHVTCAATPGTATLLDIWGNIRAQLAKSQPRRNSFSTVYKDVYAGGLEKVLSTAAAGGVVKAGGGLDFVVLEGRFRVAMAMKAYAMLSPHAWVLLGNCERDAYAEIFNFYDKARELRGGGGGGGKHEGASTRCLLRRKRGAGAPAEEEAEEMFRVYMTTDGGGHVMGS